MGKILVVDSMQQNIDLLGKYLTNVGYDVYGAVNGMEAMQKARLIKPDIIILELIVPQISGYDICKRLKSLEDTKRILILIVTAVDTKEARTRAFESGADDFLNKPVDNATLLAKVKSLFRVVNLSEQLRVQYYELEEKNNSIERQLKMARKVQSALVKEYDNLINNVHVVSKYVPAMDIGGDMYDIFTIDKHKVGLFISDVSGHGISAALLTAMIKAMARNIVIDSYVPNDFLAKLNNEIFLILENEDVDFYICAFYVVIDTEEKTITYSNAGHALPIYVDSVNHKASELSGNGTPLGMLKESKYELHTFEYENEDTLLLHTDGLCDSFYKENPEEFNEKLKVLLVDEMDSSGQDILEGILNRFYNYDKTYENDDVSMIYVKM